MGGRTIDLLVKLLAPSSRTTYPFRASLPPWRRCHGCGRVVRDSLINSNKITTMPWKRGFTTQVTAPLSQKSQEEPMKTNGTTITPPLEHPRDISAAIIKLSHKRRTNEALHKYLKALYNNQFPSKESLYQLAYALYRQKNLTGLYAFHDTLISHYKNNTTQQTTARLSNRRRRSMIYLYTILLNLISNNTPRNQPLDTQSISRICSEMAELDLAHYAILYDTLLQLFMKRRDLSSCHDLYDLMKQREIEPTKYTYSIMLRVYGWEKDLNGMTKLLDDMYDRKISPDAGIVSVVVFGVCRLREFDTARQFVNGLFQSSGGDAWLIGIKMREQLLKSIDKFEQKRHKTVRARKLWKRNNEIKKRKIL
ncbi:hypothetical protein INT45_004010 [Circinella minor]|uniref:Pentatricopeptide repeat-containing protein n=1 Tax=Circinella minor TaxID=1195481 RepID=A0A8H7VH53_9FUNG|nr:hypothetical protein INT45_004010 [Circinella minor]